METIIMKKQLETVCSALEEANEQILKIKQFSEDLQANQNNIMQVFIYI